MSVEGSAPGGRRRHAAVGFILVSVGLDVLSLGVMLPVLSPLIQRFEHGDAAAAGRMIGIMSAVWAGAQFFGAPVLGALSDRFGRRPVLLISLFGLGLDYLLMAFAPSLPWLFVGRTISGFTRAGMAVANAYIADVTPPEKRASTYGLTGAAWGVGFILGPSLGGLLGDIHIRLPFIASAVMTIVGALYGLFVLPESLAPENRAAFAWKKANPVGSLRFLGSHPQLMALTSVYVLLQFAHVVLPTVFIIYAVNRYGWSLRMTGAAMALTGICNVLVQGLLVRRVVPVIGEWRALLLGLGAGALGFAVYGLSPLGWMFLIGTPIFGLIGFFTPGYQGLITRRVSASEQGRLQGANASLIGLTGIVAPLVFGNVYGWSVAPGHPQLPGAAFLLASSLMALGAVIAVGLMARAPKPAGATA